MHTPTLSPFAQRALIVLGLYTASAWALILIAMLAWSPGRSFARSAIASVAQATTPASAGYAIAQAAAPFAGSRLAYSTECQVPEPVEVIVAGESASDDENFSWRIQSKDGNTWADAWDMNLQRDTPEGQSWFWFRQDGIAYVVRDPELVAEAQAAAKPLQMIGAEMGKVGGELGRNGGRMGRIGGRMGSIAARLAAIETRHATRNISSNERSAHSAQLEQLRAELAAMQTRLEAEQLEQEAANAVLNQKMSELSAKHAQVLEDVRQKVREIAARALREGRAERPHAKA